jgi:hypothetical protein
MNVFGLWIQRLMKTRKENPRLIQKKQTQLRALEPVRQIRRDEGEDKDDDVSWTGIVDDDNEVSWTLYR